MSTGRTIGLVPQVKACAVCIGGPLDGNRYMVGIGGGKAFAPTDADWKEHQANYRCEYLTVDGMTYHVIIHESLSFAYAIGLLLKNYGAP